jgi:hypothetical protein
MSRLPLPATLKLLAVVAFAALGTTACVVVPAYPAGHGYYRRHAPPVVVTPAPPVYYHPHPRYRRW